VQDRPIALLCALALLGAAAIASEQTVWWLSETYKPSKRAIEGLPVQELDVTWRKVLPLTKAKLSGEAKRYLKTVSYGVHFSLDGEFNGDTQADRALVGVYERVSGEQGRFVLILTRTSSRTWKKAFLAQHEGKPGFSYITFEGGKLGWLSCFECDAEERIAWSQEKGYQLEVPEAEEESPAEK